MMKRCRFLFPIVAFTCLWAQNDMHANINLQFRFTNPGARAQAMGGAFVGLADDTTAIFANPAGLTRLSSQMLVFEANHTKRDNPIPFFGGSINQVGLQDFDFNLESRDFPSDTTSIPFVAYVRPKGKVRWGVFYAEQGNFDRRYRNEGVSIPPDPRREVDSSALAFFAPGNHRIDLGLRSLGISAAVDLTSRLSFGATVAYSEMSYDGFTRLDVPDFEALFPDINFAPSFLETIEPFIGDTFAAIDVSGDDRQLAYNLGLLYTATDRFSLGLSYKRQPGYDYDYRVNGLDGGFNPLPEETGSATFNVPDSYSGGFAFRATDTFLVSVEVSRLLYSDLRQDFHTFFENANDPINASLTIEDTTEYRIGAEYFFINGRYPVAVRAGYWFEPYHALVNEVLDSQILFRYMNNGDFEQDVRQAVFLRRFAKDLNHITFGLGMTFGPSLTLDASADISEDDQSYSLSSIYRF